MRVYPDMALKRVATWAGVAVVAIALTACSDSGSSSNEASVAPVVQTQNAYDSATTEVDKIATPDSSTALDAATIERTQAAFDQVADNLLSL